MRSRVLHPGLDAEPTARAAVKMTFGDDVFELVAEVPAEGAKPRHMLPMLRDVTEEVVARAVARSEAQGRPISCKAGCGACCRQLVPLSQTETHILRELVQDLPEARRREIERRFADARAKVEAAGLLDTLLEPKRLEGKSDDEFEAFHLAYFALGIPCPFLEDESCSIHPERPLICRQYLVTNPAEACATPSEATIAKLPLAANADVAMTLATGDPKSKFEWVPLVVALEWSELHPEDEEGVPGAQLLDTTFRALQATTRRPPSKNAKKRARR
jgi:Fe-S-cluster containining protein